MSARVTPRSLKCRLEAACRSNAAARRAQNSLIPIRVRKFLRTKPGGGFSLLVSTWTSKTSAVGPAN